MKDRFAFKQASQTCLKIGSSVEISLLHSAFKEDKVYLDRLLKPGNFETAYQRLRAANEAAKTAESSIYAHSFGVELVDEAFRWQMVPTTYFIYARAIKALKNQEAELTKFCTRSFPNLSQYDQLHLQELTEESLANIQSDTPADFTSCRMPYSVLKKLVARVREVGNQEALFRLIENGKLETASEMDPAFIPLIQDHLEFALEEAVKKERIAPIQGVLRLTGNTIRGYKLGELERIAYQHSSENALNIFKTHAADLKMDCSDRIHYSYGKYEFHLKGLLMGGLVIGVVLLFVMIPSGKDPQNPPPP